jgi:hypothetical protein
MSINTANSKPAAPAKSAPPTSSAHAASAQSAAAAAAFAAHLKKNQAEQLSRSMRHARRDGVGRLLAADESAPGIPQLLGAGDDAVTSIDQRHQGQQGQQGQSEARQQNQQEGDQDREQDLQQIVQQELQQSDPSNERQLSRVEAGTNLLDQHVAAMEAGNDAVTNALAERLAPLSANDGLFDVLHPDGSVLSVAVTHTPARVSLLLSTTSAHNNIHLRDRKMELEQRLGRRIGKDVVIAIL